MRGTGGHRSPIRAIGLAGLIAAIALVIGGGLVLLAGGVIRSLGLDLGVVPLIIIALVLSQLGFAGVGIAALRYRGLGLGYIGVEVPTVRDLAWIGGGFVLTIAAAMTGAALVTLTGAPTANNQIAEFGLDNPELLLVLIPISILVIGPSEELLFRGTIQNTLRETFGPVMAVVLASALFAGVHFLALTGGTGGRLVSIGVLFFPSLVLGAAYERTRNLVVSAAIHGIYDATLFGLLYIVVLYGPTPAG